MIARQMFGDPEPPTLRQDVWREVFQRMEDSSHHR
jgi:hypothetical protein